MSKVLVVGFDGATFDVIRPLVTEGRLPTLAKLFDEGAFGTLQSTIPPVTPAAWTTFFTGKNPGKHGIYDFQKLDPETYSFSTVRTDQHREKTVWQLLGDAGYRSIIMDVPFTYPPRPLNGWMITGYGTPRTPDTTFTYPENLADHLPADLQSEVRVALPSNRFDRSQRFIDEWEEIMDGRQRMFRHMLDTQAWDLFMVVFSITDTMAHVFWTYLDPAHPNYDRPEAEKYREAFLGGYEKCDELLGELMDAAGTDTTTLVLSDHGFGSVRPRQYVFRRLLEGGYLHTKQPPLLSVFGDSLMKGAVKLYTEFPILREWVKGLRPGQRKSMKQNLRRAGLMPTDDSIDYSRSKIIPSNFGLRMWVNDTARFAQGAVAPHEREAVLAELSEYLKSDRDPVTGQQIIAETYQGKGLYHGPFEDDGPDLVIEYANLYDPNTPHKGQNPHVEGGHTPSGIFFARGSQIQNKEIEDAGLIDLTPTILHLFGEQIPQDMDGRVLTDIFTDSFQVRRPVEYSDDAANVAQSSGVESSGYTDEEEEEIKEQLRQLGYID